VAAMRDAADALIGTHNFRSFGSPPQGDNPVRTVMVARWDDRADEHHFTITANAFLYRMVRRIVGTLILVGQGQVTPEAFSGILAARDPNQAGNPAPPQGLTLTAVEYR
jgi:tRNA pseudouridine38-40 synthase